MKNILMIAPTPFFAERGCHVRILNSYYRLEREGNKIKILTYPIGRNIAGLDIERTIKVPGYRKLSPGFSIYKPFLDFLLLFKAIFKILFEKYDLIYCHLHEGAFIGIILNMLFKIDFIFDCQGSLTGELQSNKEIKSKKLIRLLKKIEYWIVKKSPEIIVSNEQIKRIINGITNREIHMIPDLPDKNVFNKKLKPIDIKGGENKFKVVYLGGLKRNKGIDYLLEAIPFTDKRIHFFIFGYPIEYVNSRIEDLDITSRVTILGPIKYEDAGRYLAIGDIAVSPKITSTSGEANAKIYSYLATGLKVICFDTEENRKILGDMGYYSKVDDIKNFAKIINIAFEKESRIGNCSNNR